MNGSRKSATRIAAVKLIIFSVISIFVTGVLVAIMGKLGTGPTEEYHAIFENASLLQKGDEVRVAGVPMGKVTGIEIHDRTQAKVSFTVKDELPLTTASQVEIRYLNVVGDRYVNVRRGEPGAGKLRPGGTIPVEQTTPALNLTALYNGFAPLFDALRPSEVNELTLNIIRTLQGEGGTVESLLRHTASLTNRLADREELIGSVITNLDTMLTTVDERHTQVTKLVQELRRWVGGLSRDRELIGASLGNMADLTRLLADLLSDGRPILKKDISELRELATLLAQPKNQDKIQYILDKLPEMLEDQTRTGTYGSWYNYYVCGFKGSIILPSFDVLENLPGLDGLTDQALGRLQFQLNDIAMHSTAKRCPR